MLQVFLAVGFIAGVPLGLGIAQSAATAGADPLRNQWFMIGLLGEGLALLVLFWGLVLYVAHGHNERERCPDPSAHEERRPRRLPRVVRPHASATASAAVPASTDTSVTPEVPVRTVPAAEEAQSPTSPADAAEPKWLLTEVAVTPEHLWDFYKGHTDMQAQKLIAPYIGKLTTVGGPFADALSSKSDNALVTFAHGTNRQLVLMWFRGRDAIDEIATVPIGRQILVRGRIDSVSAINLVLEECRLVSPTA